MSVDALPRAAVDELRRALSGAFVRRGGPGYRALARPRFANPEVAWTPELIVHCASVADVQAAVRFAGRYGLRVAVRGGGIGWLGAPAGTLLVDLGGLGAVAVDAAGRTVTAEGGASWRAVQGALSAVGLAAAGPQFPSLSVGGYALGGGHGWLTSKLGWGSDTLVGADIVTATGELVHADRDHHPDLFWALRGAGHNFGVAVRLRFSVIPLRTASFGAVWFHPDQIGPALERYRDWIADAPDELTTIVSVAHPPAAVQQQLDARHRGRACAHVILCHCGDEAQARFDLAPLTDHPGRLADDVTRRPWAEITTGPDPFAPDLHRRSRMHYLTAFDDDVIATTVSRAETMGELCFMSTHHYGGALRRVDEHATAMSHRDQAWNYMVTASWHPSQDGTPLRRGQEDHLDEISAHATGAYYVNYLFDEPEHVAAAYHPTTWARLRTLKRAWDPTNRFAVNHNIPPAD